MVTRATANEDKNDLFVVIWLWTCSGRSWRTQSCILHYLNQSHWRPTWQRLYRVVFKRWFSDAKQHCVNF